MRLFVLLTCCALTFLPCALHTQNSPQGDTAVSGRTAPGAASAATHSAASAAAHRVRAERIAHSEAPVIDGLLDEQIWQSAQPAERFLQKEPREGEPATEPTEVRFCYDDDALYIGAVMHRAPGREVRATMSRRDNSGNSERIIISLDTYRDGRTAYTFVLTASGVRTDYYHPDNTEFTRDYSYDPVWEGRSHTGDDGWSAEFRIPFSQLRFTARDTLEWGLNINHYVSSINEDRYWVMVPKTETGWSSRMGVLAGITGIRPTNRIEITPYAAGDITLDPRIDAHDPFRTPHDLHGRVGLDFKMGLGPNLTLDATVHPDFGQVEADPAVVNLTAFETVFSERRPFFIEGAKLLSGNGPTYFYSRRIGGTPHIAPSADYVDMPSSSPILGAAKVTGRLANGLSIGALGALTDAVDARLFSVGTDGRSAMRVEPLTGFGVARVQQEFGSDQSTFGAMITGTARDFRNGAQLRSRLVHDAVTGGIDWSLRSAGSEYIFSGFAGGSRVAGSREALLLAQKSSARYFQRPDQHYMTLDSSRTTLAGWVAGISFERAAGEHWLWSAGGSTESPGLEINDAGRVQSVDDIDAWMNLKYRETAPGPLFHAWLVRMSAAETWNYGGDNINRGISVSSDVTFKSFNTASLALTWTPSTLNDWLTRGGVIMMAPGQYEVYAQAASSYSEQTTWTVWGDHISDVIGGFSHSAGFTLAMKLGDRCEASIDPSYNRTVDRQQYVGVFTNGAASTYGKRYVFAEIDRSTISFRLRLSYAFTPDLTLDLYAEPFAASGRWGSFGELAAPRTMHMRKYGSDGTTIVRDNAIGAWRVTDGSDTFSLAVSDFNVFSFRSNAVLRWEWLRGSTLYLIWQQDRSADLWQTRTVTPRNLFDAFTNAGGNILALKLSWWIPVS